MVLIFFKVHSIDKDGTLSTMKLGRDFEKGERFQGIVDAGTWFSAHLEDESEKVEERGGEEERKWEGDKE